MLSSVARPCPPCVGAFRSAWGLLARLVILMSPLGGYPCVSPRASRLLVARVFLSKFVHVLPCCQDANLEPGICTESGPHGSCISAKANNSFVFEKKTPLLR